MKPTKWRFQTLFEFIQQNNFKSYVEIGVGPGKTMSFLMQNIKNPDFRFFGIDPYVAYNKLHRKGLHFKQDRFDTNKRVVENIFYSDKRGQFYNEFAHDAVEKFENESIDVIFIDGNHTYDYVIQDMQDWYPKVRMGGIFMGHDYYPAGHHYYCVSQAVNDFCKDIGVEVLTAPDHVWWFKKQ